LERAGIPIFSCQPARHCRNISFCRKHWNGLKPHARRQNALIRSCKRRVDAVGARTKGLTARGSLCRSGMTRSQRSARNAFITEIIDARRAFRDDDLSRSGRRSAWRWGWNGRPMHCCWCAGGKTTLKGMGGPAGLEQHDGDQGASRLLRGRPDQLPSPVAIDVLEESRQNNFHP